MRPLHWFLMMNICLKDQHFSFYLQVFTSGSVTEFRRYCSTSYRHPPHLSCEQKYWNAWLSGVSCCPGVSEDMFSGYGRNNGIGLTVLILLKGTVVHCKHSTWLSGSHQRERQLRKFQNSTAKHHNSTTVVSIPGTSGKHGESRKLMQNLKQERKSNNGNVINRVLKL